MYQVALLTCWHNIKTFSFISSLVYALYYPWLYYIHV
jgi:hypothetical protein